MSNVTGKIEMANRIWTTAFIRTFTQYLLEKKSYAEIGPLMGMSPKAMQCGYSKFRIEIEACKIDLIKEEKAKANQIKLDQEYVTKGADLETRIYAIDGIGTYCVHGAFRAANGWVSAHWDINGISNNSDEYNLVLKTPKIRRTFYVWATKGAGGGAMFDNMERAQAWLASKCTGCIVTINIDAEEGSIQ